MTETVDIDFVVQALPAVMGMQSIENLCQSETVQWVIGLCVGHWASFTSMWAWTCSTQGKQLTIVSVEIQNTLRQEG